MSYEWSRLEYGAANHASMGDRANRTLVAGESGIIRMDVDSLGKAGERYQQDTGQRQQPEKKSRP
jgi:hypothetical protein